ncbi:hypothetical protein AAG570_007087 [Ranatra chinensis]|uniref:Uncharacterized protein n=1 Tax=Ranatra chinensis TaxID=642074 RepID=A0ABD0XUX0_9HEMI
MSISRNRPGPTKSEQATTYHDLSHGFVTPLDYPSFCPIQFPFVSRVEIDHISAVESIVNLSLMSLRFEGGDDDTTGNLQVIAPDEQIVPSVSYALNAGQSCVDVSLPDDPESLLSPTESRPPEGINEGKKTTKTGTEKMKPIHPTSDSRWGTK